jgi:hypothetical protein
MHATFRHRSLRLLERALVPLLSLILFGTPAAAQQGEQSVEFQSFRLPGWSFTPSVALGATYDTNVALTAPRASLGETQGDTVFLIVPSGQLEFTGKRTDFSLNYRGFLRRYSDVEGLDKFDQRAAVHLRRAVSRRLSLFASNSFTDAPTTDEVEVNGVPFRRTGARTNSVAAGSQYQFNRLTTFSTRYDGTWVRFDHPDALLTGGWIHGLSTELSRRVSQRVAIGGEYSYRTASLDEGRRDMRFQDAGGVVHLDIGPHTRATAAAGLALLSDRTADVRRHGPYARVSIAHELERATVGADYERRYLPSFGFGGASSNQQATAYILMPLGHGRLYTQASGSWRRTMPFEDQVLQLDTVRLRATFGYAAARWARLEALYAYALQDSIVTGGEIDRHRIGVQLVISEPMRIR